MLRGIATGMVIEHRVHVVEEGLGVPKKVIGLPLPHPGACGYSGDTGMEQFEEPCPLPQLGGQHREEVPHLYRLAKPSHASSSQPEYRCCSLQSGTMCCHIFLGDRVGQLRSEEGGSSPPEVGCGRHGIIGFCRNRRG